MESGAVEEQIRGYFLLERGTDDVVTGIMADLIYGDRLSLGLPDAGAMIEPVDPYGCTADTANTDRPERDGWAAGKLTRTGIRTTIYLCDDLMFSRTQLLRLHAM